MTPEKNKGGNCAWFQLACWGETAALNEWDRKIEGWGQCARLSFLSVGKSFKLILIFWNKIWYQTEDMQCMLCCVSGTQSRFTAAELVCQIPDNLGSPAHCCECLWRWGGGDYEKDASSPFIFLQESDREILKHPQEESTKMTSRKDQQGPLCSPRSSWMPAVDQARTTRTAHFTVLFKMDSPQTQKRSWDGLECRA